VANNFISLVVGVETALDHLHSPDEVFRLDRHRPANTFPPVFTGFSIFFESLQVGFHPIYKSMNAADSGVGRD